MFVALREIRSARGRFGLMVAVVTLITFLLVVLTALTEGLGQRSTSAVEALPADAVVLAPAGSAPATYADSAISAAQQSVWEGSGARVHRLGIGHVRLEHDGAATTAAVLGVDPAGPTAREAGVGEGVVLAQESARALGVQAGGQVTIGPARLRVTRVVADRWYAHSPVAYLPWATFVQVTHQDLPTALLVDGPYDAGLDARAGTTTTTPAASLAALPGYRSERSSLLLVQGFLYAISALVVVAFVSVWTIQRTRDLAVLRALGASRRYVLRDALGQAAVLLVAGAVLGVALAWPTVVGLASAAPVLAGARGLVLPALGVAGLGLVGSLLATRRVARVDPLLALGGS